MKKVRKKTFKPNNNLSRNFIKLKAKIIKISKSIKI